MRPYSRYLASIVTLDSVGPYCLEMQAEALVGTGANLYEFWSDAIYREVMGEDRTVLNLASKEYAKAVERQLRPDDTFVTCVFGELEGGRVVQKGVYAKMARGEMVRYLASIAASSPEQAKGFDWSSYAFDEARPTETSYVFTR